MKKARVLLGDDHAIVIEGLRSILERKYEIVATCGDGRSLIKAVQQHKPDVVVVDISMPLLNGLDAARQIRKADPEVIIIVLTMHRDPTYATEALEAGASGYVLKHSAASELIFAIEEAMKGGIYISPRMTGEVIRRLKGETHRGESGTLRLSTRQREVLQLVAEGHAIREIADLLHISPRTVEFHKYRIAQILGLRTNAELTQYAVRHGIIAP